MTSNDLTHLSEVDRRHTLRPWTSFEQVAREGPLVIVRGEGNRLWDAEGRDYLDAVGGLWCTNIGLGRREMAEAIAEQAERLAFSSTFVDMTNDPSARLSAKLAEIAPEGMTHVHQTTGGSTALDSAFRMAQFAQTALGRPEKTHMIARQSAYHGSTYAAISLGLRDGDRAPEFQFKTDTIHHVSAPNTYRRPDGMSEEEFTGQLVAEFEAKIEEIGADRVAAFFAEPVQASGGLLVPPDDYLRRMHKVCQANDILFVADEVVTAFGRLGHWFASEDVYGVKPDIICTAKGLSSGYQPIGAVIFSDEIWQAMAAESSRWYTSGFTYSGHPVACAAALKNIEIIEREGLLERSRRMAPILADRLGELGNLPLVGNIRSAGLMACVESVADKTTKALLPDELDIGHRISAAAEARGLLVRPLGHLNVMSPALTISESEIEFIADTLEAAIVEVTDQLTREGTRIG